MTPPPRRTGDEASVFFYVNFYAGFTYFIRSITCHNFFCLEKGICYNNSEAILKLYNDHVLRDNMGRDGRAYAVKYFSRQACITEYEKLFLKACEKNK